MAMQKSLPEWFELKKYEEVSFLSSDEIKHQISERRMILTSIIDLLSWSTPPPVIASIANHAMGSLKKIMSGEVIINREGLKEFVEASNSAIQSFSSEDAINHYLLLKKNGFFENEPSLYEIERKRFLFNDLFIENRRLALDENEITPHSYSVNIDLRSFTNKEILDSLQKLLPLWRTKLKINEPHKDKTTETTFRNKAVQYRALPIIDLMIWCFIYEHKISRKLIFQSLFNDYFRNKPITDKAYDEVIKPFILKCFNGDNGNLNIFSLKIPKNE